MPKVLMSFHYRDGWSVMFFETDRRRTKLPRSAFFNTDEAMLEFVRRGNGAKTLEDKKILEMQMRGSRFGDVTLELTDEQFARLKRSIE
jgi:hypothetical protein